MTPEQLADGCVKHGVGNHYLKTLYVLEGAKDPFTADGFINDGRVVLAMMEKCSSIEVYWDDVGWVCSVAVGFGEHRKCGSSADGYARLSKSEAILEACLQALGGSDG